MNDEQKPAESKMGEINPSEPENDALDAGLAAAFGTENSIASGAGEVSVLKLLGNCVRRVPRVFLKASVAEGEDQVVRLTSTEVPTTHPDSRYRLDGEIARGGMGVIIKGRDTDLGRDLAIKVMLNSHKDRPDVVERFIEEAQIGGQLQHPGIAPVYELGQFQDKRPFFTMKLVKGETLSTLLSERETLADDRARYLDIFARICQTMAYAHSRGVIHRDLKPINIMVGAFGEVQVMDWGLAKVLGAGDIESEKKAHDTQHEKSPIETIRTHGSDTPGAVGSHTQAGSVLGTPAYMSPEQAAGEVDSLDERADVFGLGAILCEILTGEPPYVREDKSKVLELAKRGQLDDCFDRLAACGGDQELTAIVRDCLAANRDDRSRNAGIVSKRMTNYLESVDQRLRQVELDRIAANTRADEERKRRKVTVALAVSTMITFGAIGGGWLWVHQTNAAQAKQLTDQINRELSTARALRGGTESDSLPDTHTLTRALEAAQRAYSLCSDGAVDAELSRQVNDLVNSLEAENRDQHLHLALENIWEWEMDRLAEQDEFEWHQIASSGQSPPQVGDASQKEGQVPGWQVQMPALAGAATLYERALTRWGLKPGQTSLDDAARRIQALNPACQASVLVSLDRWRGLLVGPRSLQDWEQVNWSVLESVKLTSRGGDPLEVQPDGSILASGDHPQRGNDLVLETGQQDIVALRMEAMLDDSLPGRGADQGRGGLFAIDGLRVWCAPKAHPDRTRRLKFRFAVANHSHLSTFQNERYLTYPLSTGRWHITDGVRKARTAVFEVESPVHSDSGFQLTISHRDGDADEGGQQDLGRFRWSVSADRRDKRVAPWLGSVIDYADRDDWRRSMRSEIRRRDVTALIQRALDTQAIEDQPEIILVQLARALLETDDTILLEMLPDTIDWEVLKPISLESQGGATLELQDDGSIFSSGRNPFLDTLVITVPVGERPITAIRLETIPDHRLPNGSAGRGLGGQFALVEFEADVHPASDPDAKQQLAIDRAIADFARSPGFSLAKAVDGLPSTAWHIPSGHRQPRTAIFVTTPPKGDGEMIARIVLKSGSFFSAPGRFRLSVAHEPIHLPHPKRAALTLLQHIHQRHPDNYWVNLALAETLSQQTPPALDEALPYVTAALALRPDNAMSHAALLRVLPTNQLGPEHPRGKLAIFHAKRVRELDPDDASIQYIAAQLVEHGFLLHMQEKPDEAIAAYNLAIGLQPGYARAHHWLGFALAAQGKLDEAIDAYHRALEIEPQSSWPYADTGFALFDQGKFDKAIAEARRALEIDPELFVAYRVLGVALAAQGRLNEATDAYGKTLELARRDPEIWSHVVDTVYRQIEGRPPFLVTHFGPNDPFAYLEFGLVMAEEGRLDKAIQAYREAIKIDPENGMAWYHLGNGLRQQDSLDEAIQAYREAIKIDPKYTRAHRGLGVALIAQDKFHEALRALQKSMSLSDGGESRDWFYVAISEWQLGNEAEARQWYDRAVRWMEANDPNNERLVEVRTEAERTLGLKKNGIDQVE